MVSRRDGRRIRRVLSLQGPHEIHRDRGHAEGARGQGQEIFRGGPRSDSLLFRQGRPALPRSVQQSGRRASGLWPYAIRNLRGAGLRGRMMATRNSEYARLPRDGYQTPGWVVTDVLAPHVPRRIRTVWECASGDGQWATALHGLGYKV